MEQDGTMETYGYARVSSTDQNLDLQEAALRAAGCTVIRSEKVSGTKRDGRDELAVLLQFLRSGGCKPKPPKIPSPQI